MYAAYFADLLVQPDWGSDGFRSSFVFSAAAAVLAGIWRNWAIRASTVFRLVQVCWTSAAVPSGLYRLGFSTMPASMAACGSVSFAAEVLK